MAPRTSRPSDIAIPWARMAKDRPSDNLLEGIQELNAGHTLLLNPSGVLNRPGAEEKFALYNDHSKLSQIITAHFAARSRTATNTITPNPGGPTIGVIEFSAGGAKLTRVEFDIPVPRLFGENFATVGSSVLPRRDVPGGLSVQFPASGFQLLARNDGSLLPANDGCDTAIGTGPVEVSVHIARFPVGGDHVGQLKRSVYAIASGAGFGANPSLAPGAGVNIGIPPYAVRARFMRVPLDQPLRVIVGGVYLNNGSYIVPVNSVLTSPDLQPLELSPDAVTMLITNTGAVAITALKVVFDIEI